jgi:hypothetical protein
LDLDSDEGEGRKVREEEELVRDTVEPVSQPAKTDSQEAIVNTDS